MSNITIGGPIDMDEFLFRMTGWTRHEITRCGYNPATREQSEHPGGGCQNTATILIHGRNEYRLCDECAALPRFKRFKNRRRLVEGEI